MTVMNVKSKMCKRPQLRKLTKIEVQTQQSEGKCQ